VYFHHCSVNPAASNINLLQEVYKIQHLRYVFLPLIIVKYLTAFLLHYRSALSSVSFLNSLPVQYYVGGHSSPHFIFLGRRFQHSLSIQSSSQFCIPPFIKYIVSAKEHEILFSR
jgi:hypothetical protein